MDINFINIPIWKCRDADSVKYKFFSSRSYFLFVSHVVNLWTYSPSDWNVIRQCKRFVLLTCLWIFWNFFAESCFYMMYSTLFLVIFPVLYQCSASSGVISLCHHVVQSGSVVRSVVALQVCLDFIKYWYYRLQLIIKNYKQIHISIFEKQTEINFPTLLIDASKHFDKNHYNDFIKNFNKLLIKILINLIATNFVLLLIAKVCYCLYVHGSSNLLNHTAILQLMYAHDLRRKICIEIFKTYFMDKYILSQTIFSSNHCKTRIIFCFTCKNSKKSYITNARYCFTDKLFKNAFPRYDNYMLLLETIHVRSRIEFKLLINSVYLENVPDRTLNLFLLTPFLDTFSHKPWSNCFTITYIVISMISMKNTMSMRIISFLYHA